jgi:hypothetical protein
MSGNVTVIYAADPDWTVSADKVIKCLHFLQASGVIGGPIGGSARAKWRPSSLIEAKLGLEFAQQPQGPGCVLIECHEKPTVYADPSFTVACPQCGALLYGGVGDDRWTESMTTWQEHEAEEPLVTCGCGTHTPVGRLKYVDAAVTRFAIVLEDAVRPIPDTSLPLWGQLEEILRTKLGSLVYTRV